MLESQSYRSTQSISAHAFDGRMPYNLVRFRGSWDSRRRRGIGFGCDGALSLGRGLAVGIFKLYACALPRGAVYSHSGAVTVLVALVVGHDVRRKRERVLSSDFQV